MGASIVQFAAGQLARFRISSTGTVHSQRGAQCFPEPPLALADNCAFRWKASRLESAFATASPASEEPAVSSRHWQPSLLRSKSSGLPPNTCVSGIKEQRFIFRFCPNCGTTVFHTGDDDDQSVSVAVGAFADPSFPAPQLSVYDSRRHPWFQLPPGTETFDKDPTGNEQSL